MCETWASDNECSRNPDYMLVECGIACGLCNTHQNNTGNSYLITYFKIGTFQIIFGNYMNRNKSKCRLTESCQNGYLPFVPVEKMVSCSILINAEYNLEISTLIGILQEKV